MLWGHAIGSSCSLPGEVSCTVSAKATTTPQSAAVYVPATGNIPLHLWANYALTVNGEPAIGYTQAQIHSQFVANMNFNFDPTKTWSRKIQTAFAGLSDVELARLTMLYVQEGGNLQAWVNLFVGWGINTHRLAAAVGEQLVVNGLAQYGSAAVAEFYAGAPYTVAIIPRSVLHYQSMGLDPKAGFRSAALPTQYLDFTSYEIYLDFRTGATALSVESALVATAALEYVVLKASYDFGVDTGNGILWVADQVSPGFSEWLASELGSALNDAVNFQSSWVPEYNFADPGCGCSVSIDWDDIILKD